MKWLDLPPVWLIGTMAAMWGVAEAAPFPALEAVWIGRGVILAALVVMAWTAIWFRRKRTTIIPHLAPDALVTEGPMRFSRNPIYAADALVLIGWGLSLGAALSFLLVPVFVWTIERRFIRGEEARLQAAFGDEFADYTARVRRWI